MSCSHLAAGACSALRDSWRIPRTEAIRDRARRWLIAEATRWRGLTLPAATPTWLSFPRIGLGWFWATSVCGDTGSADNPLTCDQIVPHALGGTDTAATSRGAAASTTPRKARDHASSREGGVTPWAKRTIPRSGGGNAPRPSVAPMDRRAGAFF
jgi:hypothetical protein